MNKPIYLGLSILELSKTLMYEFWYGYLKPKHRNINTDDIYKDIAEDVETRFDNSNYRLDRPLPKGKNKQVIGLYKDKSGKNIMIEFV